MHTPPRSPGGDRNFLGKTFSPKTSGSLVFDIKSQPDNSSHVSDPDFSNVSRTTAAQPDKNNESLAFNPSFAKSEGALAMAKAFAKGSNSLGQPGIEKSV